MTIFEPEHETNSWEHYFRDAAELRVTIERNMNDLEFTRRKGRIVYVFDSNIVKLFLDPVREIELVTIFSDEICAEHLSATATITAELLFSRQLAGQRGTPPFLAPSHAEELSAMMHEIEKQLYQNQENVQESKPVLPLAKSERIRHLVEGIRDGKIDRDYGLDELRKILPRAIMDLFYGPGYEAAQFKRIYEDDLLRPLALDPAVTANILNPDRGQVSKWANRILEQRQSEIVSPRQRSRSPLQRGTRESRSSVEERVDRDAQALVQVLALNNLARDVIPPTRYVLVTADRAMYRAYSIWFWQNRNHTPEEYVLRHPSQYVPILNSEDMLDNVERFTLINHARDALESLLRNVQDIDPNYPHVLSYYVSRQYDKRHRELEGGSLGSFAPLYKLFGSKFDAISGDPREFDDLKTKWCAAARNAVIINSKLMRRRHHYEIAPLADLLRSDRDIQASLLDYNTKLLDELEIAHMALNVRGNLVAMIINERQPGQSCLPEPGRGPLAVRTTFSNFTNDQPLNIFLDELVANADRECLSDLNHQLRSSLNYSGMFFAACVAFRSGQWAAARHYGDRALTMLKREDIFADCASEAEFDRHELLYFMALVTRFSLNDYSEFNKARALLEETFQYHVRCGDAFGLMRAKSELAALFLVLLFKRILFGDMAGRFNWGDRNVYFSQAVDLLREARDLLGMSAQKTAVSLITLISMQVYANIVSAAIYQRHLARCAELLSKDEMLNALDEMETQLRLQPNIYPMIVRAEYWLLRWSLEANRLERVTFKAYVRSHCLDALSRPRQLTDFDGQELRRFLEITEE
jgi:hypothetical protein